MNLLTRILAAICLVVSSTAALADNVRGAWSAPFSWPLISAHTVLTPDGRVLTYGTDANGLQTGYFIYDVWDPLGGMNGGHLTLSNMTATDIFCSSQLILAQTGNIFLAGGDNFVNGRTTNTGNNNTTVFSPVDNSLVRGNNMNRARWYSSSTTLPTGEIYIQGGSGGADLPEIRDLTGGLRLVPSVNTSGLASNFPRNFLAPDSRIFGFDTSGKMYYVTTGGLGSLTMAGQLPGATSWTSSAVMFRPGRILQMGGASSAALVIDINGAQPAVASTQSMSTQRQWVSATVLPDGRVLGTGGSTVENQLTGVNNVAEIWDPNTGVWTQGASGTNARLYHSGALLLPDASVLITGGGAPGPLVNLNSEIYYPPYLFDSSGALAARPSIVSSPDTVVPGDHMSVGYSGAASISKISLIKTGSTTHSVNMDQRYIELPFTANGNLLDAQLPSRPGDLPPGYYLLFVLNGNGVPSNARIVRVGIVVSAPPPPEYSQTAGGTGGNAFLLACQANEVLVGVRGSTATYVNQVAPQCVRVDQNGRWVGSPVERGITGSAGTTTYSKNCPVNTALSGFRGRFSSYVNQLDFECTALTTNGKLTGTGTFLGAVGPATGTAGGPYRCNSTNPAFALYGRSGSWIDAFGIQCQQPTTTFVNSPPNLTNPGSQSSIIGTQVNLPISASDPDNNILTLSATGLPPGLTVDSAGRRITGVPTTLGNYAVALSVFDGVATITVNFSWSVAEQPPFELAPLPASAPKPTGTPVTYTAASTNGINVVYSWFFDDGTPATPFSSSPTITHTFTQPGVHYVTVTASSEGSPAQSETVTQMIHLPLTAGRPTQSSNIVFSSGRLWVVNQDSNTVSVFDTATNNKLKEISVGAGPRTVAIAPNGNVWVTNKFAATISVISPSTLAVTQTFTLPFASQPFGIAFAPTGGFAFVALEATGTLLKLDASTGASLGSVAVGPNPRHVSVNWDGTSVYVSRFITPPLPGESTAVVQPGTAGGEVVVVSASSLTVTRTITLQHSNRPDFEIQGSGIPNYLAAAVISPDGLSAWVPSKQDNILRGTLRNGSNLNFQNTVRAIASRIDLATGDAIIEERVDLDNASVASAAAFDPYGSYLFVALETSREVAVLDAHSYYEIFRFNVGRAPQGLVLSADGKRLYVNNFMDRTVGVFDTSRLLDLGESAVPSLATLSSVATEALSAQILKGKQFFYDARDTRLARDAYMSCASCHNDGGSDGRTWDLTGQGEGLRNTIALRGRAGAQGFLHWSGNFDEVQDFEGQIRSLAGGTGLMTDAQFNTGTRSQPLGDAKAGVSSDLDALAAYVASLNTFASSPRRNSTGTLTTQATTGREVFRSANCAQCHGGAAFTISAAANLRDIGTLKPSSGTRLGGALTGIDVPTLRDVWATAPYLHDGSASTVAAAISAHNGLSLSASEIANLAAYVEQIGDQESSAPVPGDTTAPSQPTSFTASEPNGIPVLSWAASTDDVGVVGYIIYRSTNGTQGAEVARTSARTWQDSSFVEGTRYTYSVKAYDAAGNLSALSALRSVTPSANPSTPTGLAVTLSNGDPKLTWSASTDNVAVAGYIVYRSTNGGNGSEIVRVTSTTWTDTSARAGTRYYYNVRAYDAAGNTSSRSSIVNIRAQ